MARAAVVGVGGGWPELDACPTALGRRSRARRGRQGRLGLGFPVPSGKPSNMMLLLNPNQLRYNVYKGTRQITGPSPSNLLRLATNGPPPGVLNAGHNISPRLRKQLVLELEVWKMAFELVEGLPRRILLRQATSLDQHAPSTST